MSFTYVLTNTIGQVRLLISDTIQASAVFTDEEIQFFLDQSSQDIYFAALGAYFTLIRDRARLAQYIQREGYRSGGYAIDQILKAAESLKEQALSLRGVQVGTIQMTDEIYENWRDLWLDSTSQLVR